MPNRGFGDYWSTVASIPIPGRLSLRPVKNGGNFHKLVDQSFLPIFHWAKCTLNKTFPPILFTSFFHFSPNKTFSLEGKEVQNGGENLSQKLAGTSAQNWAGSCARFWFQIWGDRSHCWSKLLCSFVVNQKLAASWHLKNQSIVT